MKTPFDARSPTQDTISKMLFNLNYGHLLYAVAILMAVYLDPKEHGWKAVLKVPYVLLLVVVAFTLVSILLLVMVVFTLKTGMMTTVSVMPITYIYRAGSICSRLSICLGSFVFILAISFHMGTYGYIAGIVFGMASVFNMLFIWILGDPDAKDICTMVLTIICGSVLRKWRRISALCSFG